MSRRATLDDDPDGSDITGSRASRRDKRKGKDRDLMSSSNGSLTGAAETTAGRVTRLRRRATEWGIEHPIDRHTLRPGSWPDIALGTAVLGLLAVETVVGVHHDFAPAMVASRIVAGVSVAAIAWRPRLGPWFLVLALVAWLMTALLGDATGADVAPFVGVYTVATLWPWRRAAAAIAATVAVGMAASLLEGKLAKPEEALGQLIAQSVVFGMLAALGLWIGARRMFLRNLVVRTENLQRERDVLERDRDALAREAVAVERARIARELHDVVAHHVSVMVIQAGAAEASLPPGATAAAQAIEAIGETGREAMAEMRRLLGLLRSEAAVGPDPGGSGAADRAPQPRLSELAGLIDRTREAGVGVTLEIVGAPRRLPAAVDLSVYRVVQEALTNTLRHAGTGAVATVRVVYEGDAVSAEIIDDGRGAPTVSAVERGRTTVGHGIVGMRERVALFGGRLEAGPRPGGGFRVMARFPVDPEPADPAMTVGDVE